MAQLLAEILRRKREDVAELLRLRAVTSIRDSALRIREKAEPNRLRKTLAAEDPQLKIIAEYKRRSPSKGIIREDLPPAEVASIYQDAGACAISVLTEKHFFGGSIDDLVEVRGAQRCLSFARISSFIRCNYLKRPKLERMPCCSS